MMFGGDKSAAVQQGHRNRAVRLDEISSLLRRRRLLVQRLAPCELQEIRAQLMRTPEIAADEVAHPKSARRRKDLGLVVKMPAELERANIVLLDFLHGASLGRDQGGAQRDAKLKLGLISTLHAGGALQNSQPTTQMSDRLQSGTLHRGLLACLEPEACGRLALARLGQVIGEEFRFAFGLFR